MNNNYFWYEGDFYAQTKGVAMGTKYAPSVANLFMSKWEEEDLFRRTRTEMEFYRRDIDDIFMIWSGTEESLKKFLEDINHNRYGIKFTGDWNKELVNYLDLQIFKNNNRLDTRTFFKETDRNGYIPTRSCHHPKWIGNMPKGQLMRMRRNCSSITDFERQADVLIKRFTDKGYEKKEMDRLKEQVKNMDRSSLLHKKERNTHNVAEFAFLTGFNRQYKQLENIFKKHWPILKSDRTLGELLPKGPRFIYRRAPNIRNRLVHNVVNPLRKTDLFPELKGFFRCRKCLPCRESRPQEKRKNSFISTSTGKEYKINQLITCTSTHVTYVIECPCRYQYVGRTTRPLWVRIREHINNIKKGYPRHSLSRHFKEAHRKDPGVMTFYGIDRKSVV